MTTTLIARTSKTREATSHYREDERQATTTAAEQAEHAPEFDAEYAAWKRAQGLPDRLTREAFIQEFGLANDYAGIGCY